MIAPRARPAAAAVVIVGALVCALAIAVTAARAREGGQIRPIPIPASHAKARTVCPDGKPLACRAALIHAYEALAWQRLQNVVLARELVGNVSDWTCVHNGKRADGSSVGSGEGPWNANSGNGYFGGLQMDRGFMATYGADMIRRHHGGLANTWTPKEQIIVAERARASGRGYKPWPLTARACGLLS